MFHIKTFILFVLLLLMISCSKENRTTDTYSKKFNEIESKILFLKKYLNLRTEIDDAEFYIKYHDNSSNIPGPSDWYYRIALKVNSDSLSKWNLNCITQDTLFKIEDWESIIPKNKNWNLDGQKLSCEDGYILIPEKNIVLFLDSTF